MFRTTYVQLFPFYINGDISPPPLPSLLLFVPLLLQPSRADFLLFKDRFISIHVFTPISDAGDGGREKHFYPKSLVWLMGKFQFKFV